MKRILFLIALMFQTPVFAFPGKVFVIGTVVDISTSPRYMKQAPEGTTQVLFIRTPSGGILRVPAALGSHNAKVGVGKKVKVKVRFSDLKAMNRR